jgi:hypothetical protein
MSKWLEVVTKGALSWLAVFSLVVCQIVAPTLKGFLSTRRKRFGCGWQAGSSPGERCSRKNVNRASSQFQGKELGLQKNSS